MIEQALAIGLALVAYGLLWAFVFTLLGGSGNAIPSVVAGRDLGDRVYPPKSSVTNSPSQDSTE